MISAFRGTAVEVSTSHFSAVPLLTTITALLQQSSSETPNDPDARRVHIAVP